MNFNIKSVLALLAWTIAVVLYIGLQLNIPKLEYTYLPDQLSTTIENGEVRGFFVPQTDEAGNHYSWTRERASLLFNFQTARPFKLTFEVRSAAVAGGPATPTEVLVNGVSAGWLDPPQHGVEFQSLILSLKAPDINAPVEVTLVAEPYQPSGEGRVLGTMIKSIKLDKHETWDTLGKRTWLWWILGGLALIALSGRVVAWRNPYLASRANVVTLTTLGSGAGIALIILSLYLRIGIIDQKIEFFWLFSLIYLILVFSLTALAVLLGSHLNFFGYIGRPNFYRRSAMGFYGLRNLVYRKMVNGGRAFLLIVVYGVLGLGLLAPSASSDKILPDVGDLPPHLGLIIQARQALEEGQFPLRVAPWEHQSWRYPTYQYYGQLPDTLGALLYKYLTPDNPYLAYLILNWLALVLGAFYIYHTSLWLTHARIGSVLAGMLYMASPYFLINIHGRGALAEAVGQGVLPIALYYTLRCYSKPSWLLVLWSGLGWFLLIEAHIITFVFASLFVAGLLLCVAIPRLHQPKTWFRLIRVGLGFGLGWLLACYYLAPLLFQQDNLYIQDLLTDPYDSNELTPISGLMSPTSVPPWPGFNDSPGLNPAVGWPMLLGWGVVAYYYLLTKARLKGWPITLRHTSLYVPGLLGLFVVAVFMTWSPIDFWSVLPKALQIPQFSYRMLAQVDWVGALLVGYALVLLVRRLEAQHFVIGLLLIGFASSSYLPSLKPSILSPQALLTTPTIGSGNYAYIYKPKVTALYTDEELPLFALDSSLLIDQPVKLPTWLPTQKPVLHFQGLVTLKDKQVSPSLAVIVDGHKVGQTLLKEPSLIWDVPLAEASPSGQSFNLSFTIEPKGAAKIQLALLTLTNLPVSRTLVAFPEIQKAFHQQGVQTVGQITIKESYPRMVQLPILYYPQLLEVRLDGQKTSYIGLPHWFFSLVGLEVPPGTHQITIEFVGLQWANWVSLVTWFFFLVALLVVLVFRSFKVFGLSHFQVFIKNNN